MLLLFDSTRRLAELAADADLGARRAKEANRAPWREASRESVAAGGPLPGGELNWSGLSDDDPLRQHLCSIIEVAVVGGQAPLGDALIEDAAGWSPSFSFAVRSEAEAALEEQAATLTVLSFDVDSVIWAEPVAFAEWRLDATVTGALLVADDVLVEAQGRPLFLAGATVARLHRGRIAIVHTYYDEASLIEQVILQH